MIMVNKPHLFTSLGTITKKAPWLHRGLVLFYHLIILEIWPPLRRLLKGRKSKFRSSSELNSFLSLQSIRSLSLSLPSPRRDEDLIASLQEHNIRFFEGGWTIYLPPSGNLKKLMPQIGDYPLGSGVKILRDLRPPAIAHYTRNELRPVPGAAQARARTPDSRELLRIAGALFEYGIGAAVYDLVELEIGDTRCTGFITEHVDSDCSISEDDYQEFIKKLGPILEEDILGLAHGDHRFSKDFRAPDCQGNLLKRVDGRACYVDFQSFYFFDEKKAFTDWAKEYGSNMLFGPRRLGADDNYVYQMIPGMGSAKRETLERWNAVDHVMKEAGIEFNDSITFDVGCNAGLMSYYALSKGAQWAYGWDRPEVADASRKLLRMLGATRWTVFGTNILPETKFSSLIPKEQMVKDNGVLFYLAISKHIGFPNDIANLPWKYCIYEGHSNEEISWSVENFMSSGWAEDMQVLATGRVTDGDSPTRSIIIFRR